MRFVALWFAALCILVGLFQLGFGTQAVILDRAVIAQEPWRVITSIFAHSDAYHLLSNLFALCLFGLVLEGRIGPSRVAALFLISGVAINLIPLYERSLGASGAIFSFIGALAILRPRMVIWVDMIPMPMALAGVVYVVQDVVRTWMPTNIGTLAHISGLFIGAAAGLMWRKRFGDPSPPKKRGRSPRLEKEIDEWEREHMGSSR